METYIENRKAVRSVLFSIMIGIILTIAFETTFAKSDSSVNQVASSLELNYSVQE